MSISKFSDVEALRRLPRLLHADVQVHNTDEPSASPIGVGPNQVYCEVALCRLDACLVDRPIPSLMAASFEFCRFERGFDFAVLPGLRDLMLSYSVEIDAPCQRVSVLEQLTALDLPNLDTDEPISHLSNLKNIEILTLCFSIRVKAPLTLRGIAGLGSLRHLALIAPDRPLSIEHVAELRGLSGLSLQSCNRLIDITPLSKLQHLQYLDLGGCESIDDWDVLPALQSLTALSLESTYVPRLDFIDGLPNLRMLRIANTPKIDERDAANVLGRFLDRGGVLL